MGNERYTSLGLSRQLAESGLEQNYSGEYWHRNPWLADDEDPWFTARWDDPECGDSSVRALRLDDVLKELTREREGGPLTKYVTLINTQIGEWRLSVRDGIVAYEKWGGTPVEAAGLVLLALLRERGGK